MSHLDPQRYIPESLEADPQQVLFWAAHEGDVIQAQKALNAGAGLDTKLLPYEFPSEGELHHLHRGWPYSRLDGCKDVDGLHGGLSSVWGLQVRVW